ncbi:MAG: hypothetical protein P8Z41_17565 [Anaerolineales bacterium]
MEISALGLTARGAHASDDEAFEEKENIKMLPILKTISAIATIVTGAVSLFWPLKVLGFTGLDVNGGRGVTEIRTILGALFIGLGAAVLYFNTQQAYQVLGITYLTMAVVRGMAMFVDDAIVSSNLISFLAELVLGIILVV